MDAVVHGIGARPHRRPARIFVLIVMFKLRCVLVERDARCSRNRRTDNRATRAARTDLRLDRHGQTPLCFGRARCRCSRNRRTDNRATRAARTDLRLDRHGRTPLVTEVLASGRGKLDRATQAASADLRLDRHVQTPLSRHRWRQNDLGAAGATRADLCLDRHVGLRSDSDRSDHDRRRRKPGRATTVAASANLRLDLHSVLLSEN